MGMEFGRQVKKGYNHTRVIIPWIKSQATEFILGTMAGSTKAIFKMIIGMAMVSFMTLIKL